VDFCGFRVVSVKSLKFGGGDDAGELDGHADGGGLGLRGVPGGVQAAGLGAGGVVAGGGVPADGDCLAREHERDSALDRAGGAVAGLEPRTLPGCLSSPAEWQDNCPVDRSDGRSGWFSYTNAPSGRDHLAPEIRAQVEEHQQRRGRLLCKVLVSVYEHDTVPSVAFPAGALFNVETDAGEVTDAVNRARDALQTWR